MRALFLLTDMQIASVFSMREAVGYTQKLSSGVEVQ
jgi:hypothetical protein